MSTIGVDPTKVYTAEEVTSGSFGFDYLERGCNNDGSGTKEYVFVLADEALTSGNACLIHEDGGAEQIDTTSSAPGTGQGLQAGLCVTDIASGGAGWLQVYGIGDVSLNVATSAAAHTILNSTATAGRLDDDGTASSENIDGITTTATESSNTAACVLYYPRVGATN